MKRGLLCALGLVAVCGLGWGDDPPPPQVHIEVPEQDLLKLKYAGAGIDVRFDAEISNLGDHTYEFWWTWDGGQTGKIGITEKPSVFVGFNHTFAGPGEHFMALEVFQDGAPIAGDVVAVWILKLEITEPDGNPSTDNHFVFDATPHPNGSCTVTASGTTHVASEDGNMWWWLDGIAGSTLTTDPDPAEGPNAEFTYTTLPSLNSEFGVKYLNLKHPMWESDWVMAPVEIFFAKTATNHPGANTGVDPNWYFYWSQTPANTADPHEYDPDGATEMAGPEGYYSEDVAWDRFFLTPRLGTWGIDTFARTCLHEKAHMTYHGWFWWPYDPQRDRDEDQGDMLDDDDEPTRNGRNGQPYSPELIDTDGDGIPDNDDFAIAWEAAWELGAADAYDWAYPGKQSGQ